MGHLFKFFFSIFGDIKIAVVEGSETLHSVDGIEAFDSTDMTRVCEKESSLCSTSKCSESVLKLSFQKLPNIFI